MAEHAAAGFVEDEVAQGFVPGDPARLFPHGGAGRRGDTAHDHVADFAFGVAADYMNDF
ncbi:hypothetical protein D3C85_432640 [compost metagenome]